MRHRDLIRKTMADLSRIGITPLFPNLDYGVENKDGAKTSEEKKQLAIEHYEEIDEADAVYFLTPEGYMGTSCKIELGYAIAKNKSIYFSEPTDDMALDCYVKEFIPLQNLQKFLA